jgi:hypothetical protein
LHFTLETAVVKEGTDFVASLFAGLGTNTYTTLSQTLHLIAGDVLSGNAKFLAHDYFPYNDDAYVSINGQNLFASNGHLEKSMVTLLFARVDFGFYDWCHCRINTPHFCRLNFPQFER